MRSCGHPTNAPWRPTTPPAPPLAPGRHRRAQLECIFISCTAIRAVEILEDAEAALGKPVLSAIQCLFWEALRLAGYDKPIDGFGSLLRA